MDILVTLPKKTRQLVRHYNNGRYTKLTKAILNQMTNATTAHRIFVHQQVPSSAILIKLLTDNWSQFVSMFFVTVCSTLGVNDIITSEYHPHTNIQAERFNFTIVSGLRHFVSEHLIDWGTYLSPMPYAGKGQMHRSLIVSPLNPTHTRTPTVQPAVVPKWPS